MWIQTCATVVCSIKNNDEQNIICVNYVVTNREHGNMILDQCQLGIIKREPIVYPKVDNEPKSPNDSSNNGDRSRGHEHNKKSSGSNAENKSLENSSKDVRNCDDDATTTKRGRKRKVKAESRDEEESPHISVKELENVMSKHLPKSIEGSTDFSTDTLLRNADASSADKSSTFGNFPPTTTPMPATALLRQLYANRESVIRATSRPANYFDSQQSLPTPPNDTSYLDSSQYLRKPSAEAFNYGYSSMEYNNAMTPPSSVSPRDLTNHKTSNYEYTNLTPSSTASDARGNYQNDAHLPLKPHPYSIHQMDHHSSSYGIDHQSQYFSPYHTGFHLYHKNIYTPP